MRSVLSCRCAFLTCGNCLHPDGSMVASTKRPLVTCEVRPHALFHGVFTVLEARASPPIIISAGMISVRSAPRYTTVSAAQTLVALRTESLARPRPTIAMGRAIRLQGTTPSRLMRESEQCVEHAACSPDSPEQAVASRVLQNAGLWRTWAAEHLRIMRDVGTQRRAAKQITVLKLKSFALIHRKALFEYLRDRKIRGNDLRRVLALFHSSRCQTDALIAEHGQYLRSACSYMCATHLGSTVVCDGSFQDPFAHYEDLYREYFRAFCDVTLAGVNNEAVAPQRVLIPLLKYHVIEQRRGILHMPRIEPGRDRGSGHPLRVGDTQKIYRPVLERQNPRAF